MTEGNDQRAIHLRQEVWEEREAHEAEQAFYDRGGSMLERRLTPKTNVRIEWLHEQGLLPVSEPMHWVGDLPDGFKTIRVGERRIAMSELVNLATFRRMLVETRYHERYRIKKSFWERANKGEPPTSPVGATWVDAQAFCAWKERQIGGALRLPTKDELRAIHPFHSQHYAEQARGDFLWEHRPPLPLVDNRNDNTKQRRDVPSAVVWSEPRFLEPSQEPSESPAEGVWRSAPSRKRWIKDFPPQATWCNNLPWGTYSGRRFIDAWDAYEWCQESEWIHGRFWEGQIGESSWGAYKNVKVSFRLVLDLEG